MNQTQKNLLINRAHRIAEKAGEVCEQQLVDADDSDETKRFNAKVDALRGAVIKELIKEPELLRVDVYNYSFYARASSHRRDDALLSPSIKKAFGELRRLDRAREEARYVQRTQVPKVLREALCEFEFDIQFHQGDAEAARKLLDDFKTSLEAKLTKIVEATKKAPPARRPRKKKAAKKATQRSPKE